MLLIEQPFAPDRLLAHADLARRIETPVCLDESITSLGSCETALALKACRIVNIKLGRVGGLNEARAIHDLCADHGVPVWCGGMLESGVGRAANLALASLPNFTLPGDISASRRYFSEDVTDPFELADGAMAVPTGPGIGVTPHPEALERLCVGRRSIGR
jgi:O-succinylbenzoate synthase